MPPKSRISTLVAFEAEASRAVDPDSVVPVAGIMTLVVGEDALEVSVWVSPALTAAQKLALGHDTEMRPSPSRSEGADDPPALAAVAPTNTSRG